MRTSFSPEIVIIGAGIIGMSTALQLARRTRARILVLEKGSGPGEGSTGASSAVCRFRYTRPETIQLARDGIAAYQNWSAFVGLPDPVARFHRHGVLWLGVGGRISPDRDAKVLGGLGIRTEVLDDRDLEARYPAISPCVVSPDLETGEAHSCHGGGRHLLEVDGGYIDPVDALQDLIRAAASIGVRVRYGAKVTGVAVVGGRVTGVTLGDGEAISCSHLVNAAGPWCNAIFDYVGLDCSWPLQPTRIQIAVLNRPPEVQGDIPVTVDTAGGIYFRTQNRGQQIIIGSVAEVDEREVVPDPGNFATFADDDFVRAKLHALEHRIPGLTSLSGVRGYSGLYTMNRADVHPVVGETPIEGFYVANGFSGHGFKLAPAIGSLLAQTITGEKAEFDTDVDRSFLAFDRTPIHLPSKSVLA
jgi:glycine/D-amino acid oxidase-like deaminating enzyme